MNICAPFIRRPVMTTLIMAGLLIFGVAAHRLLPVSELPNVDFPSLQVTAGLPGANPETIASSVATPLEREFSTIAGLDSMTSTSAEGITQITLQFATDALLVARATDIAHAERLVALGAVKVIPETVEASLQLAARLLEGLDLPEETVSQRIGDMRAAELERLAKSAAQDGA